MSKYDVDITKMSVNEFALWLKQMNLKDVLIYIIKLEGTEKIRTTIIYLAKMCKQLTNTNDKIVNEICNFIDENELLLDVELDNKLNKISLEIKRLKLLDNIVDVFKAKSK